MEGLGFARPNSLLWQRSLSGQAGGRILALMAWRRGYLSLERLLDWVRVHPLRTSGRLVPICVWGRAGAAKTQKVKNYCKVNGLGLKVYQPAYDKTAADLVGQKAVDPKTGKTVVRLPDWLPVAGECEDEGILFIDEINRGGEDVLQGLMQPLGEGEIQHIGWKLPPGWIIVCAANPPEGDYNQVNELDQAMVRRMINYTPGWNAADWTFWGEGEGQIQDLLMDFVFETPHLVDAGEGNLMPESVKPVANARTLEYLSAMIEPGMPLEILDVVSTGLVGAAAAERIILKYQQLQKGIRGLTGGEILRGVRRDDNENVHTVLRFWMSKGQSGLIRSSTGRLIASLYGIPVPAEASLATQNAWMWLCLIPDVLVPSTVAALEESIPDWLDYLTTYGQGEFGKRIPEDRSEIVAERAHDLRSEQSREEVGMDWDEWDAQQAKNAEVAAEAERQRLASEDPFAQLGKGFQDADDDADGGVFG
jgi:hypothetical protein